MPKRAHPPDGYVFNAFVSYRQHDPDRSWVRKTLIPGLDAAGLRICYDDRNFDLGAMILTEMERAVVQSRYTIAVLTPKYLASTFTDLESVLARHLGLEMRQRRFLAILREACDPGLDLRARLWLDMTDDGEFEEKLARLADAIRKPVDP